MRSLHAYVAPGQGLPFWSRRSEAASTRCASSSSTLDAAVAPAADRSPKRSTPWISWRPPNAARANYARRGETLLAGDVIFTEVRDLLAAVDRAGAVRAATRSTPPRSRASRRCAANRPCWPAAPSRSWIVIAVVAAATAAKPEPVKDPNEWRDELAANDQEADSEGTGANPKPAGRHLHRVVPVAPVEPSRARQRLVARGRRDLRRPVDAVRSRRAVGRAGRAAAVLDATGVIVWIASNDGSSLSPVATHGFDPKLVARIGRIARDSANLTAAAFRDNVPRVSAATATAPAALAVAMCGPTGPVGVLSVELKAGRAGR